MNLFFFLVKNVLFYSTLEIYSNTRILLMLYHSERELPYLGDHKPPDAIFIFSDVIVPISDGPNFC